MNHQKPTSATQRARFVQWMQTQPQKRAPGKTYKEATIGGMANCLQRKMNALGVPAYAQTDCFTITDVPTFSALYAACYAAAAAWDRQKGHRDFEDALEFYLAFLQAGAPAAVYFPTLAEYNPGITKDMWVDVLRDGQLTPPETRDMLCRILAEGGESTCGHLAEKYGRHHTYYSQLGATFGKKVKERYGCPDFRYVDPKGKTDDKNRFYVIPFVGRDVAENGKTRYSWKLRDELMEALEEMTEEFPVLPVTRTDIPKNTVLYGPPGTGKTYHTVVYAVSVVENRPLAEVLAEVATEGYDTVRARYKQYLAEGKIAFTTFHQSYGYEEFIEGIRPVLTAGDTDGDVRYDVVPGVFKRFCSAVPESPSFDDAWDALMEAACAGNGSYTFTRRTSSELSAFYFDEDTFMVKWSGGTSNKLRRARVYAQWLEDDYEAHADLRGRRRWMLEAQQAVIDTLVSNFGLPAHPVEPSTFENRVFIIDEINRGNISKILGELITLLEDTRRLGAPEETTAILPYSGEVFGVPDNVYILGTMNTADRSIAAMDTALRRRFAFVEMLPDPATLSGVTVEGIEVDRLLALMNDRIAALYDREHTVGHALFMKLRDESTMECLGRIFEKSILPLLQEYFYEDYEKIRLVLGDSQKSAGEPCFIVKETVDRARLFGNADADVDTDHRYTVNRDAFLRAEAYRYLN